MIVSCEKMSSKVSSIKRSDMTVCLTIPRTGLEMGFMYGVRDRKELYKKLKKFTVLCESLYLYSIFITEI